MHPDQIEGYQFGESEILNIFRDQTAVEDGIESKGQEPAEVKKESKLETLTQEFVNLLRAENADYAKVAKFFEEALGLEGKINEREKTSLGVFFNRDKFLLATLLQQEGGFNEFSKNFDAISDGCFANIGTAVRTTVFACLIKDPCDQILFSVFNDKINVPILNSTGGVDHHAAGQDAKAIFTTTRVNDSRISSTGLVEAIKNEFVDNEGKIIRNVRTFLDAQIGEEKSLEICQKVFEKNPEDMKNFNAESAEIAAYIILEKALPEILENKYLANFKNSVKEILDPKKNLEGVSMGEEKSPEAKLSPKKSSQLDQSTSGRNR